MKTPSRDIPDQVHDAAEAAWSKFRDRIAAVPPAPKHKDNETAHRWIDPDAGKSPEQLMIEKIKRRMREYPEWYETDPERIAAWVGGELERIGGVLERELPVADEPVEILLIPLSVFNWLTESARGEGFFHGALKAWSNAEKFNAANRPDLSDERRDEMRAPFFDLAPVPLKAILEELLETDLWITFAEKFVGPELKYLVMRAQRPA